MEIRNCTRCKRLFQYNGQGAPICPLCKEKEEADFKLVKEYIYENKDTSMTAVSEATGVSVRLIEKYIREGRLILTDDSPIFIKCEKCGEEIKTGRFCVKCSASLSNEMRMSTKGQESSEPRRDDPNKNKMHYFNTETKKDSKKLL